MSLFNFYLYKYLISIYLYMYIISILSVYIYIDMHVALCSNVNNPDHSNC